VYLFVIQGKPLMGLLRQAVRKGIHKEYAQRMLDVMAAETSRSVAAAQGSKAGKGEALPEPLSERELEVLRLLNTQLSVPEIARELTVAPSTIRTHVRVVYNKLGVHGRFDAIQRAKELKLI
jgi:LuxR family transcriptional regulator, maltose regulon positive regulatory protein